MQPSSDGVDDRPRLMRNVSQRRDHPRGAPTTARTAGAAGAGQGRGAPQGSLDARQPLSQNLRRSGARAAQRSRQPRSGADVAGAPARNSATIASTIRVKDSRVSTPTCAVIRSLLAVNSLPGRT